MVKSRDTQNGLVFYIKLFYYDHHQETVSLKFVFTIGNI